MAVFKCKMCGGALEVEGSQSITTCEYCGTAQTLPRLENDRRTNLYDRANHFRRSNEFDKAMSLYEQILNEDGTDAEAYWSLVLCRYGIEYVEDPTTRKRMPTVNRMQYTSVLADEDYKSALQYADGYQRSIYEEEARAIDEIQKGILAISQKEDPFDVFICYKESDEGGRRTRDSVLAQELYYQLKQEGFKVFFSRITLEDKLGSAYEPYIFAALNSAKVMVVLGTKPEFFNAVWVKNEWSRYLALIRGGAKKMLIPAYKDMDPYDMPEEFSHLQAQDMSRLGFMQDLIRGIKKIVRVDAPKAAYAAPAASGGTQDIAPLLRRIAMFLEDGDWANADTYCERVLDQDPENGKAYVMKTMARLQLHREEELAESSVPLETILPFKNAMRFADAATAERLVGYTKTVNARLARLEAERQERERLAREEQERQERLKREIQELYQQRYALEEKKNAQLKERSHLQRSMKDLQDEIKSFPNPILVRIFGLLVLGWWFMCFVMFVGAVADLNGYLLLGWLLCAFLYFPLFAVFAKICRRSIGLMFINLPTIGFFGVVFSIIMLIKSLVNKRSARERELNNLNIRFSQLNLAIETMQGEIVRLDQTIQARQAFVHA